MVNVGVGLADRLEGHLQDLCLALLMGRVRLQRLELRLVLGHHRAGVEGQMLNLGLLSGLHKLDGHLELEVWLLVIRWRRGVNRGQSYCYRHLHRVKALVLPQQNHLRTHLLGHVTQVLPIWTDWLHLTIFPNFHSGDLCFYGVFWELQQGRGSGDQGASVGCQRLSNQNLRVTLCLVGDHTVLLLKLLPTDGAGELISGISVVLLHVPVERGLLTTSEATDLTPIVNGKQKKA